VTAAGFLDENFGVMVTSGLGSVPLYTTDGGQTWTKAETDVASCRFGLDIVDAQTAWICGRGATFETQKYHGVSLSTDGGQTWQAVTEFAVANKDYHRRWCKYVSFLDGETGWAFGSWQLAGTIDGGTAWREISLPEEIGIIVGISLRTATDGYLLDSEGILYVTEDGGETWSSHSLGLGDRWIATCKPRPVAFRSAAVRFLDADRGIVVLNLEDEPQSWAMRTTDGGQTWQRERVPIGNCRLFLTRDGNTLTAVDLAQRVITVLRYQGS
jgi:photosystem II stability/assembly factor-like uncharacterized protein